MTTNNQQALKNILFLDIETVACVGSYEELASDFQALWDKKAASLQSASASSASDLFFEKAAIYAEFGKVIVIGLGFITFDEVGKPTLRTKALQGHDEKALLLAFHELLDDWLLAASPPAVRPQWQRV